MKTLVIYRKFLTTSVFTLLVSLVLPIVPASATEFEVGTQFGFTQLHQESSSSILYLQAPTGEISGAGASPYLTFFPHKQFAISPTFSFAQLTRTQLTSSYTYLEESINSSTRGLYLGSKFHLFLLGHEVSNPYLFSKVSITSIVYENGYNELIYAVGVGAGYQWHIAPVYFLRLEGQYHRIIDEDDHANAYSVTMGIGVRFGNNEK